MDVTPDLEGECMRSCVWFEFLNLACQIITPKELWPKSGEKLAG